MSVITIRSLDPAVKARIQARAKANGRSMEAEVRAILAEVPDPEPSGIHAGIAAVRQVVGSTDILTGGWCATTNLRGPCTCDRPRHQHRPCCHGHPR